MKVIFDSETDTLSIILRQEEVAESDEIKEGVAKKKYPRESIVHPSRGNSSNENTNCRIPC